MHFFAVSSILIAISTLLMAAILFLSSHKPKENVIWAYFCIVVSIWGIGGYFGSMTLDEERALFWWQIANIGSIFSPIVFYHFILEYLKRQGKLLLTVCYAVGIALTAVNFLFSDLFLGEISIIFNQFYYMDWVKDKNIIYLLFYIGFYWLLLIYSFLLLVKEFFTSEGIRKNQMKYFIVGMSIGWLGGCADFLIIFGIAVYPYSNILIAIYPLILGFAMSRFRFMDIKIAFTRLGIFILVYSLVLGFPLALTHWGRSWLTSLFDEKWFWVPILLLVALATVGPFIYLFIQKKAEAQLLIEQHQYQATLRRASLGMGRIKDLKHLLKLIVHILTRTVKIEHSSVYLLHRDSGKYTLKASKGRASDPQDASVFEPETPLIKHLQNIKEPILYEEIKQQAIDYRNSELKEIANILQKIGAELIVPCIIEKRMLAFVVLGKKREGKMYTHDDLVVFSILGSQSALAIENAMFYEDAQKTTEQLFKAEKMATLGTMADGLSHQINNRLHSMGFVAGDALDTVKLFKNKKGLSKETKEMLDDIEYALTRIEDNVKRGGEIVGGLLRYTRKGDEGFAAVELDELLDSALEMAQFKIKLTEFTFERNFNGAVPKIRGNFTQLQEVLFNIIDNAYDAMMQRKRDLKENDYAAKLEISVDEKDGNLEIIIEDNGIGVKTADMKKIFTPFFTTKATSKKGTGLGMYVIRQIIEENHEGTVSFSSRHKIGSKTVITLPKF